MWERFLEREAMEKKAAEEVFLLEFFLGIFEERFDVVRGYCSCILSGESFEGHEFSWGDEF